MALLEQAAGQGHAYAMYAVGDIHDTRKQYSLAVEWLTKAAEAGLPRAMSDLGIHFDKGQGVAADYAAAADWYRRAADAGDGTAAANLAAMYHNGRGRAWQMPVPPH
jgi:TPR repeat protein